MLEQQLKTAVVALGLPEDAARLTRSDRPDLADYQCNVGFVGARVLRKPPQEIAKAVADQISDPMVTVSVVGGYVNFRLTDEALTQRLHRLIPHQHLGETILFDYGGPNIAKPMHVGHLRSLVLGNALANMAEYLGYDVSTDIHFGDWGFQMGLLLAYSDAKTLDDLERDYVAASAKAKTDPLFKQQAQQLTVALQNGDPVLTERWEQFAELSRDSVVREIAFGLGISFTMWLGESATASYMDETLSLLDPISRVSDGALIAGDYDPPLILRNSEGGYLYAATDLATLLLRRDLCPTPDRVIYVVDQRQALHFEQVFDLARYVSPAKLEHIGFGTVNGPDGKPFKTRDGGVPRLSMLISEAISKAEERIDDPAIARWVALAAIKFADLQTKRTSGYSFDLDRALAMEGKTGAYMLYQNVRIKSICSKATVSPGKIEITTDQQRGLAFEVSVFEDAVGAAWETRQPHLLCDYLYGLSQRFSAFYAVERVSDSPSNLSLAMLVQERLDQGLRLLGIQPVERM